MDGRDGNLREPAHFGAGPTAHARAGHGPVPVSALATGYHRASDTPLASSTDWDSGLGAEAPTPPSVPTIPTVHAPCASPRSPLSSPPGAVVGSSVRSGSSS